MYYGLATTTEVSPSKAVIETEADTQIRRITMKKESSGSLQGKKKTRIRLLATATIFSAARHLFTKAAF